MSLSKQNKNILFILFCLLLLYIAWGTSFFFTKLGLAYVPGVLLGGVRATISGILLFLLGIFYSRILYDNFKRF